jgi:alpha-maltose-1-phosphate synthase
MNILYFDHFKPGTSAGGSVHIHELLRGLSRAGNRIIVLNREYSQIDQLTIDNGNQKTEGKRKSGRRQRWPIIRKFRGELSLMGLLLAETSIFLSGFLTIIRHRKQLDLIYRRHSVLNSEFLLARLFRIPLVNEVNGIVVDELRMQDWGDRLSLWIVDKIERFTLTRSELIMTVTPALKEILASQYSLKERKMIVVQNGANTDIFRPMDGSETKAELKLDQNIEYICFAGSLVRWQGVDYLLKSLPAILEERPDARVLIVGNGPIREELVVLAKEMKLEEQVIFVGEVPYTIVPKYINSSEVCVAPKIGLKSGYSPLKLCEYMACKKPVVASRASGLEILEESGGGILIEPGNWIEISRAVINLLNDKELREKMGKSGWEYVVKNQSWDSVAKRVTSIFEGVKQDYVGRI